MIWAAQIWNSQLPKWLEMTGNHPRGQPVAASLLCVLREQGLFLAPSLPENLSLESNIRASGKNMYTRTLGNMCLFFLVSLVPLFHSTFPPAFTISSLFSPCLTSLVSLRPFLLPSFGYNFYYFTSFVQFCFLCITIHHRFLKLFCS